MLTQWPCWKHEIQFAGSSLQSPCHVHGKGCEGFSTFVSGFHGQVLVLGGLQGWILRSCQKFLPCPAEAIVGSSKMDVLPAKAGPFRNSGNASVIIDLRTLRKVIAHTLAAREEWGENT